MDFWKCNAKPDEKFCVTTGAKALMITYRHDELKVIERPLNAGYAANIKARYKPDTIENYPILKGLVHLLRKKS